MEKRKPGIEKAIAFIKNGIATQQFRRRLPHIQLLANEAQVSFVTMWKAVNQLKKLKVIGKNKNGYANIIYQNKNIDFKEHHLETSKTQLDDEAENGFWQKAKNRLKKDILSGRYPHGQLLPSCKELMYHHGVSFRTLKKVLDALVSEGLIKPFKRGFIVPVITISEAHARVVAIGCGWKDGKIWADYQDKNYFRILESECIQSKISLDVIVYNRQKNDRLFFIHSATRKPYDLGNDNILGIIYIVANLEVNPEDILKELSLLKKPVAVLDVVGYFNVSPAFSGNCLMQFFTTTASAFPAKMVARYLLSLRHTHIAFISPFHRAPWSKIRYKSCASVYRDAGFPEGVKPFVLDRYAYQWDYLRDTENREDLRSLLSQYTQWKEYAHSNFFRKFGNISYSISKYLTEWNCASGEIYKRMRSLCEKALRDKAITAWLMANDFAATLAFDYLKEKNIRVPEDISIVAFDNTLDAMECQLTSYDFNNNGIVTMMLRYVLTPSTIPVSQRGKFVEVEGTIVVRRSTAPARTV